MASLCSKFVAMITLEELKKIATERLDEAETLLAAKTPKPSGAVYLAGYSVEVALKFLAVRDYFGKNFPNRADEFNLYSGLKTHDLSKLLELSQKEGELKTDSTAWADWQVVKTWKTENRYNPIDGITEQEARDGVASCRRILVKLGLLGESEKL